MELKAAFVTAGTIAILVHHKSYTQTKQSKGCGQVGKSFKNQADNRRFDPMNGASHLASRHGSSQCYIHRTISGTRPMPSRRTVETSSRQTQYKPIFKPFKPNEISGSPNNPKSCCYKSPQLSHNESYLTHFAQVAAFYTGNFRTKQMTECQFGHQQLTPFLQTKQRR
jgi:hypothetical protein